MNGTRKRITIIPINITNFRTRISMIHSMSSFQSITVLSFTLVLKTMLTDLSKVYFMTS